jgi:hypothetical protein
MSAIAEAIKLYGPDFPRVHGLYLEHGYCYSEPAVLALARPCIQSDYKRWVGPEEADAWWVELVVGPLGLATLYSHIPFPLPKIGWAREFKGKPTPRFYNFSKLKTVINTF